MPQSPVRILLFNARMVVFAIDSDTVMPHRIHQVFKMGKRMIIEEPAAFVGIDARKDVSSFGNIYSRLFEDNLQIDLMC